MKQNKYDDEDFFAKYSEMPRSVDGLASAGEWPAFRALLPDLRDRQVLDLGCGFGWHCRYAREQGARSVVGVDLSEKMLAHAKATTNDPAIEYRQSAIEDVDFSPNQFDFVISSLVLHYIEHFDAVCRNIYRWLTPNSSFVFSVEHPMFTSREEQDWYRDSNGKPLHWPVDHYQLEGSRKTRWIADDVIKYHRTTATYINALIDSGFRITKLLEPSPSEEILARWPNWKDECRRPMFLIISAAKPER